MNVVEIPVGKLQPWPDLNPRQSFPKEELAELAASIKERGVLEPLLVHQANGDGPWIVAGERRWRAAQLADRATVPCLVREFSEEEALEVALIENLQRSDLTPIEEARGLQRYLEKTGVSQRELAEKIGRSQPYIANRIRLLELPEGILALVEKGVIEMTWARDYLLPYTGVTIEKARAALFAAVVKAAGKKKELDERTFVRLLADEVVRTGRPLERWGYPAAESRRPVADLKHSGCTCGAPGELRGEGFVPAVCFDADWWNAANGKAKEAQLSADKSAKKQAKKAGKAIDTSKVLTLSALNNRLGWDGYRVLTEAGKPNLAAGRLLDPALLPPESFARVEGEGGKEEIACVDKKAISAAQRAADKELRQIVAEKRAEAAKSDIASARRRKLTGAVLRTVMNLEPWDVQQHAERLGMIAEEDDEDGAAQAMGPDEDVFKTLDDGRLELLAKVIHLRTERGETSRFYGVDPITGAAQKSLRDKYVKRLKGIIAARKSEKKAGGKKKGSVGA